MKVLQWNQEKILFKTMGFLAVYIFNRSIGHAKLWQLGRIIYFFISRGFLAQRAIWPGQLKSSIKAIHYGLWIHTYIHADIAMVSGVVNAQFMALPAKIWGFCWGSQGKREIRPKSVFQSAQMLINCSNIVQKLMSINQTNFHSCAICVSCWEEDVDLA